MTDLAHLFDAPESLALYRVKAERDQLQEAVSAWRMYAQHLPDCALRRDARLRLSACTCGLTALAEVKS